MAVDIGTGITIVFGTSGFSAEIVDVTPPGFSRDSVDTSHQGTTGAHSHMPTDLYESGECSFDIHFEPGTNPPIDAAAETITMTFPDSTTWTFTGFMTAYEPSAPLEDKMTGSVTVKASGTVVIDPQGIGAGSGSVEV